MKRIFFFFFLFFVSCSQYNLRVENDIIGKSDKNYTHGTIFTYSNDTEKTSKITQRITNIIPKPKIFDDDPNFNKTKFEFAQKIYTPDDLRTSELIVDDFPYAGYGYAKITKLFATPDLRVESGFSIGMVGPVMLAKEFQTFVHRDLGLGTTPNGWHNQLKNEPVINLYYTRERIKHITKYFGTHSESNLRLGTAHTDFTHSRNLLFGKNLPVLDDSFEEWSIVLSTGIFASLIARNVFLDGTLFRSGHSVTKKPFLLGQRNEIIARYLEYSTGFETILTTKEFSEDKDNHVFYGGIRFGMDW